MRLRTSVHIIHEQMELKVNSVVQRCEIGNMKQFNDGMKSEYREKKREEETASYDLQD